MKKAILLLVASFFVCSIGTTVKAQDQLGGLASLATESPKLANDIFGAYLAPYGEMFGVGLNSGWYNTSKSHSKLGFDVTITTSLIAAPTSAASYNVSNILANYSQNFGSNVTEASTVIGSNGTPTPELTWTSQLAPSNPISIKLPDGVDFRYLPMPTFKVGIGLIKKVEIMGRYAPAVKLGDFALGMWGVGAKWQFSEFIPFVKRVPFFSASVMAAYTKLNSTYGLSFAGDDNVTFNDQELKFDANAFTARLLVGANFPIINLFAGVGYGSTTTNAGLYGTYPSAITPEGLTSATTAVDPLNMDIKADGIDFNAGLRIKMAIVTLHFDYTVGKYQIYSAGLGISFR